jgi:hypothetical protein
MMHVEQSVEWELAEETEVLAENLPQCYFVYHKPHMTWPELEPEPLRWKIGETMARARRLPEVSSYKTTIVHIAFCLQSAMQELDILGGVRY